MIPEHTELPADEKSLAFTDLWIGVALLLLLTLLPYLFAWWAAPPQAQFTGTLVNTDDFPVYLSAMRQGAAGRWLFHFTFSPEPWQPKLMLLPYILAGKIQAPFAPPSAFWLHVWRLLFVLLSLYLLLLWVRALFPRGRRRQLTTWLLIVFGGGLGWLLLPLFPTLRPPDLLWPEWTTFLSFLHTPHFALAIGLEVLFFTCLLRIVEGAGNSRALIGGMVTALALALTYVYHIPVVGLITGVYLLAHAWQQRQIPWRAWRRAALLLAPLAVFLLYYAVWSYRDPYFATYAREDHVIRAPTLPSALVGLGLVGVLALFGLREWVRQGKTWLVPIWAGINLALFYIPFVDFSGRFTLGFFTVIATLAGFGLETSVLPLLKRSRPYRALTRLSPQPSATLRRVLLLLAIPSTLFVPLWLARAPLDFPGYPYYLPRDEVRAIAWLGAHSEPEDVYLASYPTGSFLAGQATGRVFAGQKDYTTDVEQKLALLEQFWDAGTSAAWRHQLLQTWQISYIYVGTFERQQMTSPLVPPGEPVYSQGNVTIYRIPP